MATGAGGSPLDPPPADLASRRLPVTRVAAERLVRISRFASGEPHFGRGPIYRFDDPAGGYGVCYIGCGDERNALRVAFAESVLHDRTAPEGGSTSPSPNSRHATSCVSTPKMLPVLVI